MLDGRGATRTETQSLRRGVDRKGSSEVIKALVPMAEILKYAPDLRSMTSGRGSFESRFDHYEEVPPNITEKIIKESQAAREARGVHGHATHA